jgi:hypothetical protein
LVEIECRTRKVRQSIEVMEKYKTYLRLTEVMTVRWEECSESGWLKSFEMCRSRSRNHVVMSWGWWTKAGEGVKGRHVNHDVDITTEGE